MALTIVDLTAGSDDPPKVEVLITDLDPEVATVTAYRTCMGVTEPVRGFIDLAVAGAASVVDREVPAQQATYRVEMFDVGGESLGFSESAEITLGFTGCWMHNPLAPDGAVKVTLRDTAGAVLSRPVPGEAVSVKGRRVAIMVTNPRQGLKDGVFDVNCYDLDTADRIQAFLGGPSLTTVPVVCIRPGVDYAGLRIHSPLFLGVPDIPEEGVDVAWGGQMTIQRIRGDEAASPAPGVFIPLLRRMDLDAFYATRQALDDDHLTRLDIDRRYDLAGYAGT